MAASVSNALRAEPAGEISREELAARFGNRSLIVVDVLPESAYNAEHIPGALNLPLATLAQHARELLPNHTVEIAVYCASFT
ncbi:MAG TPA: rhodanese-like domain-containing protein [Candidatus Binataceae bacterium]|nr:rhodanese-like domain-containing protein [Candidatus Binataceae bacterium]